MSKTGRHYLMSGGDHTRRLYQFALGFQDADFRKTIADEFMEEMGKLELLSKLGLILVPALGGIALGATLQHCFYGKKPSLAYAEKIDGLLQLARGFELPKNKCIAIFDDVTSTGNSFRRLLEICEGRDAGPVVFCGAVVNRNPQGFPAEKHLISIAHCALINDPIGAFSPEACPDCLEGVPLEKDGIIVTPKGERRLL